VAYGLAGQGSDEQEQGAGNALPNDESAGQHEYATASGKEPARNTAPIVKPHSRP
jgi:hypothetical protein